MERLKTGTARQTPVSWPVPRAAAGLSIAITALVR